MINKATATAVLLAFVLVFVSASAQLPQPPPPLPYVVSKYEGRLLELERAAIDDAFKQKITSLWIVWMSDDKGQPARAVAGATLARKAYIASMREIERREQENKKR